MDPSEVVPVAGSPGGLIVPHIYDRYLLVGDITALPAITRWLEELPTTAAGWAVIEVADETEQIPLTAPGGVEIRWLHQDGRPPGTGDALERTVRALPVPTDEQVYVWMAGEAASLKPLRHWVRRELRLDARDYDIRGY